MGGSRIVWLAAAGAALSRFPGLLWPLRPDEAGFLVVARAWAPRPDSLYGPYFVDRPPYIIWVLEWADRIGGPYFHRLLGALACALVVLGAAAAAREVSRSTSWATPRSERRVTVLVAVLAAALVSNAEIDAAAAKGEILGLPLVVGGCWLALRAVRRRSWPDAFLGALLATLAIGMKQSLVGGLVFGGVLLITSLIVGRLSFGQWLRLTAAACAGLSVPILASVVWAVGAGVDLDALWYTVVTFRSDASAVLADRQSEAAVGRAWTLLVVFVGTGMAGVTLWAIALGHRPLGRLPVPAVASLVMFAFDLVVVAASGSYWKPYLFALVTGMTLTAACLLVAERPDDASGKVPRPRVAYVVVGLAVASSIVSLLGWTVLWVRGIVHYEVRAGEAIAAASDPGDTLVVYGGRADIQWTSGLPSPYPYLWSLPMRTLDPGLVDLDALLRGDDAPTWFIEAVPVGAWDAPGSDDIREAVADRYDLVSTGCDRYPVHRLKSAPPVDLDIDCTSPARGWFGDW